MQPTSDAASIGGASATPAQQVRIITRLSPEVYLQFERSLPQPVIDKGSQDAGCDASFKLGIQFVLQRLRGDLVVTG